MRNQTSKQKMLVYVGHGWRSRDGSESPLGACLVIFICWKFCFSDGSAFSKMEAVLWVFFFLALQAHYLFRPVSLSIDLMLNVLVTIKQKYNSHQKSPKNHETRPEWWECLVLGQTEMTKESVSSDIAGLAESFTLCSPDSQWEQTPRAGQSFAGALQRVLKLSWYLVGGVDTCVKGDL